ncbi:rhodanese-like domain-containing protein [Paenibacillus chartarius]|uniref:Rhodanese-like domain-containing protein n=1 Tax=Paenibacillus chartarius TaxID=747481 RepID=A0ABV6DQG4_9BACL
MRMKHIDPVQFVKLLQSEEGSQLHIIDVREQEEWDFYHLDEAKLIPMSEFVSRLSEVPDDRDVYIVCGHGVRSQRVISYLEQQGFDNAINVIGGMAAVAAQRGFEYD